MRNVDDARIERDEITQRMLAMDAEATMAQRSFTDEETDQWMTDVARADQLGAFITEQETKRQQAREMVRSGSARIEHSDGARAGAREVVRSYGRGPEVRIPRDPFNDLDSIHRGRIEDAELIGRARNAVEEAPEWLNDDGREHITRVLDQEGKQSAMIARHMLMTGSEEYHQEFRTYIEQKGIVPGELLRAAMSLTDANGGVRVPFTLDPTVILTNAGIQDPIRSISTIKQIATNDWNGVTSAGVNAEWLGEGSEAADKSPTFAQPTITPKKAAAWVFGSYEVLADSGFANELSRLLADAKARLEGAAFATGNTGASQPRGIVAAVAAVTASIVSSASVNAFVVGDVYRVADALRARDASQASFISNKKIASLIRQFDTAGGSAFWANLGMGVPPQLLGQPAYECSTMGSVITTSANILLVGNFSQYYIIDRVGMSVMYEPMVKGASQRPTGQGGWFAFWRVGADVVDVDAFRLLQLHTSPAFTALA